MALQTIFKLYNLVFTVDGDRESNIHEIKAGNVYCKHIMTIVLFLLFYVFGQPNNNLYLLWLEKSTYIGLETYL